MNVFVTGGAGYIGSVVVDLLVRHGHRVTVFDNLERGHAEAVHEAATLVIGDLRNKDSIGKAIADSRPDAIIHFAGYIFVEESMQDPMKYFDNNVSGSINLIRAAIDAGVSKFVFSSSCAVYGNPESQPITEETRLMPANPYGESKLMVERMLDWVHRLHGMEVVLLRYFNACGSSGRFGEDHYPETHIIPLILRAANNESRIFKIYGENYKTPDGTCVRDYIHVKDLAHAHLLALKPGLSATLNIGTGGGYSVKEVLDAAKKVTGRNITIQVAPERAGDPPMLVADNSRALSVLGWAPQHADLSEILSDAWNWFMKHPNGYSVKNDN